MTICQSYVYPLLMPKQKVVCYFSVFPVFEELSQLVIVMHCYHGDHGDHGDHLHDHDVMSMTCLLIVLTDCMMNP